MHAIVSTPIITDTDSSAYRQDFYQWTKQTAVLLRQGQFSSLDILNVAEEIESMGNAQRHALVSHLSVLLMHLLKWKYQPDKRTTSWETTILVQRDEVIDLLEDSPSLKHELGDKFQRAYQRARKMAAKKTGLVLAVFPVENPFSFAEVMTEDWLPDERIGY